MNKPFQEISGSKEKDLFSDLVLMLMLAGGAFVVAQVAVSGLFIGLVGQSEFVEINQGRFDSADDINILRLEFALNNLFTWLLPALIFGWLRSPISRRYALYPKRDFRLYLLAGFTVIASLAFVNWVSFTEETFSLPDWLWRFEQYAHEREQIGYRLIKAVIEVDSPFLMLINLIVLAVIPAVSEEFFFRGMLQRTLQRKMNAHVAIWIAALCFSLLHLQFYGFFSRMLLGAMMGYFVYFSGSLWLGVAGHFVNNALAILGGFLAARGNIDQDFMEPDTSIPWHYGLISLVITGFLMFAYIKIAEKTRYERIS